MSCRTIPAEEIKNASPEQLIRAFSPWLNYIVNRYHGYLARSGILDREDLYWSGAMALVEARQTWDPAAGSFLTHSFYLIRSAIQQQITFGKKKIEPVSVYLDAPLQEDEDLSLLDTIPSDEKGPDEVAEDQDLKDQVQAALDRLEDPLSEKILKKRYYEERTINEAAIDLSIEPRMVKRYTDRALRRLQKDRQLRNIAFNCRHVGVREFASTLTSEVERAIMQRESEYNRINGPGTYTKKLPAENGGAYEH